MNRTRLLLKLRGFLFLFGAGVVAASVLMMPGPVRSAQDPAPAKNTAALPSPSPVNDQAALISTGEKGEPNKSKLDKTKADAAELSALADQLRDELNKMNVNVFSLDVIQKTQEVEKLAKKIKGEANKR
jgi:hypothetical protein